MMKRIRQIVLAAAIAAVPLTVYSVNLAPDTQPTTDPAGAQALQVTVTAVEGMVQYRTSEDAKWQKVQVGVVLDEHAEFRTGPRSAVQFKMGDDHTVTLDRLGTVKVLEAVQSGNKITTKLGMKYGRTRYDIEAAGLEHESSIASPSSTLAVRGTQFSSYDQRPFTAEAVSLTGRVEFQDAKKRVAFGSRGGGKNKIDTNSNSSAAYAALGAVVDPTSGFARSSSEQPLIANLLSHGATIDYDFDKGIRVIRGGIPPADEVLGQVLPGRLNFVLRWEGNSDVNLAVLSPGLPEVPRSVYPIGGLDSVPSGGRIDFDHRGGKNGGIEVVYWPKDYPLGIYSAGAVHISGPNAPASLDVFLDGKRVPILTGQGSVDSAKFTSQPINPAIAGGQGIGIVRLTDSDGSKGRKK